jgi:ferredoxin
VRGCDLAAHERLARARGERVPGRLGQARFIVAVACAVPADTCFCAAMGTGPEPDGVYDVGLAELDDADGHRFVAWARSSEGAERLRALELEPAPLDDLVAAAGELEASRTRQTRSIELEGLPGRLLAADDARWAEAASTCLACGSCTSVCPSCGCTEDREELGLDGTSSHVRRWSSCFDPEFGYVHGGPLALSITERFRGFVTHKLATSTLEDGVADCVGCGRCVTWCPAGIDLPEVVRKVAPMEGA